MLEGFVSAFAILAIIGAALLVGVVIYLMATRTDAETCRERESFLNWGDDS